MRAAYKNIARVLRTHGAKGEVVVAPLRGLPLLLHTGMQVHLTPPALARERVSTVLTLADGPTSGTARVRFSCASTLEDAEGLVGCYVLARRDDLDLGPLEAAVCDLLGRSVVDARIGAVGCIQEVLETPANDVWVVDGGAHGEVLIPVIDQVVESIPDEGPIAVRLMDGLLDL